MKEERTKFGKFMFKIISPAALYVANHKVLFYILTYTWGLIGTLIGHVMFYFVRIFMNNKIVERGHYYTAKYMIFGNNWGGLECGKNILVADKMGTEYTMECIKHELGHTYQNAVMGPFVVFLGFIPSAVRYWYQRIRDKKGLENTEYDLFWYEGSATYIGTTFALESIKKKINH